MTGVKLGTTPNTGSTAQLFKCNRAKLGTHVRKIVRHAKKYGLIKRSHGLLIHIYQHREDKELHAYVITDETILSDADLLHRLGLDRVMMRPVYQPRLKGDKT